MSHKRSVIYTGHIGAKTIVGTSDVIAKKLGIAPATVSNMASHGTIRKSDGMYITVDHPKKAGQEGERQKFDQLKNAEAYRTLREAQKKRHDEMFGLTGGYEL